MFFCPKIWQIFKSFSKTFSLNKNPKIVEKCAMAVVSIIRINTYPILLGSTKIFPIISVLSICILAASCSLYESAQHLHSVQFILLLKYSHSFFFFFFLQLPSFNQRKLSDSDFENKNRDWKENGTTSPSPPKPPNNRHGMLNFFHTL